MAIIKRKTGYAVRIYRNGKQHWVGTYRTRSEARAVEAEHQLTRREYGGKITVSQWRKRWLTDFKRPEETTQITYKGATSKFEREHGPVRLDLIDRLVAREFVTKHGWYATRVVKTMFEDAVREGLLQANPFAGIRIPRPKGRKNITAPTATEIERLADTAREVIGGGIGEHIAVLTIVGAYTGMRPGELCALDWDDINFDKGVIHVQHSLTAKGKKKGRKNKKPVTIVLLSRAAEALHGLPRHLNQPHVFSNSRGERLRKGPLRYWWEKVRLTSGVDITPHVLRHYCATLLLENGLQHWEAAEQLGHDDGGREIMETYGHPSQEVAHKNIRAKGEVALAEIREEQRKTAVNG